MVTTRSHDQGSDKSADVDTGDKRRPQAADGSDGVSNPHPAKRRKADGGADGYEGAQAQTLGRRHHEKKVVQLPPGAESGGDDGDANQKPEKVKEDASPAPKKEEQEDSGAPTAVTETKQEAQDGDETKPLEGNAEEGQIPKHEPNPDPERKHGEFTSARHT